MSRHILLCGERHVGKSTLVRRLLEHTTRPLGGFVTKRVTVAEADGFYPIYLHPAAQAEADYTRAEENCIGRCDSRSKRTNCAVFDTLGVALIEAAPANGLVVMDELGFLENDALRFRAAVLRALDGDTPVLATVKKWDSEFLTAVREHPNAEVFYIDEANRDALYEQILPRILAWNEEM